MHPFQLPTNISILIQDRIPDTPSILSVVIVIIVLLLLISIEKLARLYCSLELLKINSDYTVAVQT